MNEDTLMRAYMFTEQISALTNILEMNEFAAIYCMILENWCKVHDEDITQFITMIHGMIDGVNEELGAY